MAKRKSKSLNNKFLYLVAAVLGVVAVCMIFVTAFVVSDTRTVLSMDATYTGLQTVFGYASDDVEYLMFSFINLLPYLLVIAGVVIASLKFFGVLKNSLMDWISVVLFVVGGVLFFCTANFTILAETYVDLIDVANLVKTYVTTGLGVGPIVAGICSILSGATLVAKNILKK